jgi:hypothetical protein
MTDRGRTWLCGALLLGVALAGCSGRRSPVLPPALKPQEAAQAALAAYDADGDGVLSAEELRKAPGLRAADRNKDGRVTAEEIAERIAQWQADDIGMTTVVCTVLFDGRPLEGATVTFVPEAFQGEAVKPASGVTQASGRTGLVIDDELLPRDQKGLRGVQPGFYRVEITHPSIPIPARYNTETTLGYEVHYGGEDPTFRLTR